MYATQQDLYDRFSQGEIDALADLDGDGQPNAGVIDGALNDASVEMDGYFAAAGFNTPITNEPAVTERVCCNIARYNLYTDTVPERVEKLHEDAIAWLKAVAAGKVSLGVADDGSEPSIQDEAIQVENQGSVFQRGDDGLGGF